MNSSLHIQAIVTDEVTAVEVHGVDLDGLYDRDHSGKGWSKKHPTDPVNPDLAYNLAMARALQDLANQYGRVAANIAGFPVEVALDAENPETGEAAALAHFPADLFDFAEEVAY